MKTKIYLAGGMNNTDWQNQVIDSVGKEGFIYYNPREHLLTDSKEYTVWDLFYVKKCDILFAYMEAENPSGFGLTLEVGFARALDTPIILVDEKSNQDIDFAKKFRIVRESSSIIFDNLQDGISFLKNLKNGVVSL